MDKDTVLTQVANILRRNGYIVVSPEEVESGECLDMADLPIKHVPINTRAQNALIAALGGGVTMRKVARKFNNERELLKFRNIGKASMHQISDMVDRCGLSFEDRNG